MKPRNLIAGLLAGMTLFLASTGARAEAGNLVVVELFTSQGCSSCPPADALLAKLARRDDVLALALHVDYWDYIGWADSFARPEHTRRQKAYARVAGSRAIYTPQMIVGGIDQIVGARPMEVAEALMTHLDSRPPMRVQAVRAGDTLKISATAPESPGETLVVQLIRYVPKKVIEISKGENAGKTLSYANIVTAWDVVAKWDGAQPLELSVPVTGDQDAAVLVQRAGPGPILAATRVR